MRSIALVGMAPSGMEAPFGHSDWEIWGLGNDHRVGSFERIFEIHPKVSVPPVHHDRMLEQWKLPHCVGPHNFPKEEIEKFWPYGLDSTAAYMLVVAMHENWNAKRKIGLWGFNMATEPEYRFQRENMLMLVGFARGAGFDVWIHPASHLNLKKRYYPLPLEDFVTPFPEPPVRVGKMRASRIYG